MDWCFINRILLGSLTGVFFVRKQAMFVFALMDY